MYKCNKWTSQLSAWVSKFVGENVFLFYIIKTSRASAFSLALPNTSKYVNHNALSMSKALNKCFKFYITTLKAKLNHWNFNIENFPDCLNYSTFAFPEGIQSCAKDVCVGYPALATGLVQLILYELGLSHMGSDVGQIFPKSS